MVEVLVSAGPRKSPGRYEADPASAELCEDCAGIAWVGQRPLLGLGDGASEAMVWPRLREAETNASDGSKGLGFSTRALAKDLVQAFVSHAAAVVARGEEIPPNLAVNAITALALSWEERLNAYLSLVEARGLRQRLLSQLPAAGKLDWSATFTGGIFCPDTRRLTVWNFGNAGGLALRRPPEVIAPNTAYVTFRVWLERQEPLRAHLSLCPLTDFTPGHYTDVEGFVLLTDGMERHRLEALLTSLKDAPVESLSDLRLALLRKADLTWDDKSLVFGRFL